MNRGETSRSAGASFLNVEGRFKRRVILLDVAEPGLKHERQGMSKPRFQFKIKGLLLAIALPAGLMWFLRPLATIRSPIIDFFGPVRIGQDGTIEVKGAAVRINQGITRTEIRGNRIVVDKDGTTEVYGNGTIVQTAR
jgi:hypothetical protein